MPCHANDILKIKSPSYKYIASMTIMIHETAVILPITLQITCTFAISRQITSHIFDVETDRQFPSLLCAL